jgi:hypothetical protein
MNTADASAAEKPRFVLGNGSATKASDRVNNWRSNNENRNQHRIDTHVQRLAFEVVARIVALARALFRGKGARDLCLKH